VASEQARLNSAVSKRATREQAQAEVALRKRLDGERSKAAASTPRVARKAPAAPAVTRPAGTTKTTPAPTAMTESDFWRLISDARSAAEGNTATESQLIEQRLTQLSPDAIVAFAQIRRSLDERAYTWDLWGAAEMIEDGCSDDCFRHFRGYLISLGQSPYENALRSPDSLASVAEDAETGDWESADDVAPQAYTELTGRDFPVDESDLPGEPRGTPFDANDTAGLAARYPMLAARFRGDRTTSVG
jgi:hypothetical protein